MVEKGRRPGNPSTRVEIVTAARAAFAAEGYDGTSLRRIAGLAGVDPALIHHYFPGGKAALFAESMHMGTDPRRSVEEVTGRAEGGDPGGPPLSKGRAVVLAFLRLWDAEPPRSAAVTSVVLGGEGAGGPDPASASFVSLVQAVSASPAAADALREFLIDRVWSDLGSAHDPAETALRRALFASQLNGMAFTRYVLRLEPIASATPEQLAEWIGPTLDAYAEGPLPPA